MHDWWRLSLLSYHTLEEEVAAYHCSWKIPRLEETSSGLPSLWNQAQSQTTDCTTAAYNSNRSDKIFPFTTYEVFLLYLCSRRYYFMLFRILYLNNYRKNKHRTSLLQLETKDPQFTPPLSAQYLIIVLSCSSLTLLLLHPEDSFLVFTVFYLGGDRIIREVCLSAVLRQFY